MLGPKQKNWIYELRNGGHTQTCGQLQWDDAYCCLGVACVAAESESTKVEREEHTLSGGIIEKEIYGEDLSSQRQVFAAIGLRCESGSPECTDPLADRLVAYCASINDEITSPSDCTLTRLNDDYSFTFNQIANVLEQFPTLYFQDAR